MTAVLGERAIVVGGGIGGLFSARVLSEHFEEVVVVDRDSEPRGPHARSMVPQGNHFHILLSGGLDAMCHWFPGFVDDLIETGSVKTQFGRDVYWYTPLGKSYNNQRHVPEPVDGDTTYVQTRPQLEWNIRRRVDSVANIEFRYDTLVEGPLVSDGRVVGVIVRDADPMNADLVVDASGRNSVTARWLPDLGFEAAPETYVNCDVTYASAICRPTDPDAFDGSVLFVRPDTEGDHPSRTGALSKLPNGEWMALLGGRYGDFPSAD